MPHPGIVCRLVALLDDDRKAIDHQRLQQLKRAAIAHQGVNGQLGDLRIDELGQLPGADILVFVIRLQPLGRRDTDRQS